MFNNDKPIESSSQDLLGTKSFADSLCNAILSYKEKESLSIGMYGAWGTGKTSIINMTLECIAKATNDHDKNKKPIIIKFKAPIWVLNSLVFKTITSSIIRSMKGEYRKAARIIFNL